jgi:hypothetical protein
MKLSLLLSCLACSSLLTTAGQTYDFRASSAYAKLSEQDKQRLEQVRRDQVLLWGALDMYADEHGGKLPVTLDDLAPRYLRELPSDPFATKDTAQAKPDGRYVPSKGGLGYRYMKDSPLHFATKDGVDRNRAWAIASVGLPDFPYLAESGNVGLHICKGTWL